MPKSSKVAMYVVIGAIVLFFLVAIGGIVAAIAIPNFMTAKERAAQKRTISEIRSVGTGVTQHSVEHNEYPKDLSGIDASLVTSVPPKDGWGHPLQYVCWANQAGGVCTSYAIVSPGKDGVLEHEDVSDYQGVGGTTNFDCDIVYVDSAFVQFPADVRIN